MHDWLYGGGAEKVVEALHEMYPEAPIYTSYCTNEWRERLDNKVVTGYLNTWPFNRLRKFLPLLRQNWFRSLDLSGFDVVISSCGNGEARFVLPDKSRGQKPVHIAYTHTPTHFYWRKYEQYLNEPGFRPKWLVRMALKSMVSILRKADWRAAQSPDVMLANSSHIQADIVTYYGRDSVVVHPPVDVELFNKERHSTDYYVMWGRHVPYKRFDLAVEACNKLERKLIVIGEGPDTEHLKEIAGTTIQFMGKLSADELVTYAAHAKAFLFPGEEDFGIAPVEAMAAGVPVIAYKSGGALDYVDDGISGVFFKSQSTASLVDAIKDFEKRTFSAETIKKRALLFSRKKFKSSIKKIIKSNIINECEF